MEKYCIRPDYITRTTTTFKDMCNRPSIYQRKVYEIARHIAVRQKLRTVLDFGCGSAEKLLEFFPEFDTVGVDLEPTVRQLRQRHPQRKWLTPEDASATKEIDLVICADVIEHVLDPDEIIAAIEHIKPAFVVFSTPDRDYFVNAKRHSPVGPPQSEFHVREWSFAEFKSYLSKSFEVVCHTQFDNVDHLGQVAVCRSRNKYSNDSVGCGEIYFVGDSSGKMTDDFFSIAKPLFDRARLKSHRYKDCRQFAEDIDAGIIDRDAPCTVVMVYSEEKGHLEAGKTIQDICDIKLRRCRLIHPFSLGKILGNKIDTNRILSSGGVRCPQLIESHYHDKPVFQNAPDNTQSPVCLIGPGHELNPSMYNAEFIDTRYRFDNEVYYCSIRTLCVGGVMTSLFLRFRNVKENDYSVHDRNTPLLPELINAYYREKIIPLLDDLKNICKKIGEVLGLGFYVHDLALCARTNELYVLETGFKFHERTWASHIATISNELVIDGNHHEIISKAVSEFVEQIKPNEKETENTGICAASPPSETVTVIIRSVGERTEQICLERLKGQVDAANIHIIREAPFTEALRKTFAIGLRDNRRWTLAVDADVLVMPRIIEKIVAFAERTDDTVFLVKGKILDKFLESPRDGGIHLYRTELISRAQTYIPEPHSQLRPESFIRKRMQSQGFCCIQTDITVGLHDYEQYYRDIYRKCFVHAKKHYKEVTRVYPEWCRLAEKDPDYRIAIEGFRAGLRYPGQVTIDTHAAFMEDFSSVIERLGISEKPALVKSSTQRQAGFQADAVNAGQIAVSAAPHVHIRQAATQNNPLGNSTHRKPVVIYTAISGDYDDLLEPRCVSDNCTYICFTDNPQIASDVWQIRPLPEVTDDPVRKAKVPKLLPHLLLDEFEHSIWVDANYTIRGDLVLLMNTALERHNMALFRHPENRLSIFDEAKACIRLGKDDPAIIMEQIRQYAAAGFSGGRIPTCAVLFRRHHDPGVICTMEDWWQQVSRYSRRDQLSFSYVADRNGLDYHVVDTYIRDNEYLKWHKHPHAHCTLAKNVNEITKSLRRMNSDVSTAAL